jgi:hypothetical protein
MSHRDPVADGERMKKMILAVTVAGLSVLAVAQSDKKKEVKQSDPVVSPRDSSTGMASGKRNGYDVKEAKGAVTEENAASGKVTPEKVEAGSDTLRTASEVSSGKATGKAKTTAQDDWKQQRVAAGDVNGDGKAEVAAPRDAASGQASGKRQHQPMLVNKGEDEKKPEQPKK